jgi:thiamine biosynthesis lipoprotein
MKSIVTKLVCISLCLLLLLLGGCGKTKTKRYQAEFLGLFDTVTTIVGYADSEANFQAFAEEARALIQEYHQLYDIYNSYEGINNIKTINDNAGKAPVKVDQRIIDMLKFARAQYEATGGAINVAMGAVLQIWHDYRTEGLEDPENAKLPPMDRLIAASKHTNIYDVIIDENAATVFLRDPAMRLDVGAIAKGYAAEQVMNYFEDKGVTSLLLSLGGNIKAIGERGEADRSKDKHWVIGIRNPDNSSEQKELLTVRIKGLSVVSSGVYQRYYTVNGVQYNHIIDPNTLMPTTNFAQVSVLCRDSGLADALSTAVFNMPFDKGRAYIESLDEVEAVWVMNDGSIEYSSGFRNYVKDAA